MFTNKCVPFINKNGFEKVSENSKLILKSLQTYYWTIKEKKNLLKLTIDYQQLTFELVSYNAGTNVFG